MVSLNPFSILLLVAYRWRELSPAVLDDAQATAARILRDVRHGAKGDLENQAIALLVGGVVPLTMHWLFGWPAYLVVLGIAADNLALWLGDIVKPFIAGDEFLLQWEQQCDASDSVEVARAVVAHTRRVDDAGIPVARTIERVRDPLSAYTKYGLIIAILPLSWGSLFYPTALEEVARFKSFTIIAIPVAVRLLIASAAVVRRGASSFDSMRLLPQAPRPLFAFLCTALLFVLGSLVFENEHAGLGRYDGVAFFSIYLIFSALAAGLSWSESKEAARLLRILSTMNLDSLKQRLAKATQHHA